MSKIDQYEQQAIETTLEKVEPGSYFVAKDAHTRRYHIYLKDFMGQVCFRPFYPNEWHKLVPMEMKSLFTKNTHVIII